MPLGGACDKIIIVGLFLFQHKIRASSNGVPECDTCAISAHVMTQLAAAQHNSHFLLRMLRPGYF